MDSFDNITLKDAIVAQACEDYRAALRGQCDYPERMLYEVMRFFNSTWYTMLTDLDWRYLVEKLDKEYADGKKLIAEGLKVECPKLKKQYYYKCPLCGGEAETHELRYRGRKRKDGTRKTNYFRLFSCSCHITERVLVREETEVVK